MDSSAATTNFTEDDSVVMRPAKAGFVSPTMVERGTDIKDFFARPWIVQTGSWTTSQLQGASILSTGMIDVDKQLVTNPLWASKWSGFSMQRSKAVFRLQLNASPFHSGKLLFHYLPLKPAFDRIATTYSAMHNLNITTKTMQPSVELDCRDTAAVMELPYIAPTDYYSLNPGTGDPVGLEAYDRGSVDISVLAPLRVGAGGENTVYWTLFLHFEDVDLAAPIVPQAKKGRLKAIKNNAEEEAEASSKTISSGLRAAGVIAGTLATIPFLTPIMEPAAWVADGLAGIASFFGYSKPMIATPPITTSRQMMRYLATSTGVDTPFPLTLRHDNALTLSGDETIYDADEMSFNFLKQVPALYATANWSDTDTTGASIFDLGVSPRSLHSTTPVIRAARTVQAQTGPPIWYLSHLFRFWRGSLKVTFKLAKTVYHSGRLLVTYTPRPNPTNLPTLTSSQYALREIIDIRTGDEFTFILPYLLPQSYCDVSQFMGHFNVTVLNELRHPETAASVVPLLFYVSGGDDLEFACPGYGDITANYPPFSPQMLKPTADNTETLVDRDIGSATVPLINTKEAEASVGEMLSSIRQLLTRNNPMYATAPLVGAETNIWPFYSSAILLNATGLVGPIYGGDVYSFLAPMYALRRGSMHVIVQAGDASGVYVTCNPTIPVAGENVVNNINKTANGSATAVNYLNFPTTTCPSGTAVCDTGIGVSGYKVPFYGRYRTSLNVPQVGNNYPAFAGLLEPSMPRGAITVKGPANNTFYRSIGEDFQLTYFVGCPPLVYTAPA